MAMDETSQPQSPSSLLEQRSIDWNNFEVEVVTDPKRARWWVRATREKSPVTHDTELHVFRGATLYVMHQGSQPISFHACYFGRKRWDVWTPYLNGYTGYTVKAYRRQGAARAMALFARDEGVKRGCRRFKSKAGSLAGLYLHAALGDQFWGITSKLEVVIDTPLIPSHLYSGRTPPNAVKAKDALDGTPPGTEPWPLERVLSALTGKTMRYE